MRTEKKLPGDNAHLVICPSDRPFSYSVYVGCSGKVVETVRDRLALRKSLCNAKGSPAFGEGQRQLTTAVLCGDDLKSFRSVPKYDIWDPQNGVLQSLEKTGLALALPLSQGYISEKGFSLLPKCRPSSPPWRLCSLQGPKSASLMPYKHPFLSCPPAPAPPSSSAIQQSTGRKRTSCLLRTLGN